MIGSGPSKDAIFSADGTLLYVANGNVLTTYRIQDGSVISTVTLGTSLGHMDLSINGQYLAIVENSPASGVGTIYRVALSSGAVETFTFPSAGVFFDLAFLANGQLYVTQASQGPLRLINLDSNSVTTLNTIGERALVSISEDNGYVVAIPQTITMPLHSYDLDTGTGRVVVLNPDPYGGSSLPSPSNGIGAVSPDGSKVYFSGRLYAADLQSYQTVSDPNSIGSGSDGAVFSPDGSKIFVVSATSDRVYVIDVASRTVTKSYDLRADLTSAVELRISADGKFLAVATANGVQIINLTVVMPTATGTDGNDTLVGNANSDALFGLGGADTIYGEGGDDVLASYAAGASNTISLDIYTERDSLFGGDGNDTLLAGYGDNVDGGSHAGVGDRLSLSLLGAPSGQTIDFRQASLSIGGGTITGIESLLWVQGSNFDDTINAGNNPSYITGGNTVLGMGGNDTLIAGTSTSSIDGGDGDDYIDGSLAGSSYYGGAGNDTIITAGNAASFAYGNDGNDLIYATWEARGGAGNDVINVVLAQFSWGYWGDEGDDQIYGNSNADFILGGSGADLIEGGAGNDIIGSANENPLGYQALAFDFGAEHDIIRAGDGNDIVSVGYGDDADGGAGNDMLFYSMAGHTTGVTFNTSVLTSSSTFSFGGGTLTNFEKVDRIYATDFDDTVTMSARTYDLTIHGGAGNDHVTLLGFSDPNVAIRNVFVGGDGNDYLSVSVRQFDEDADYLGGAGSDTIDFSPSSSIRSVSVTLHDDPEWFVYPTIYFTYGNGWRTSLVGVENIIGSEGTDNLTGNILSNFFNGGSGQDTLDGRGGDDILTGGLGIDQLTGGDGLDLFRDTLAGLNGDTIVDFSSGESIHFTDAVIGSFSFSVSGNQLTYSGGSLTLSSPATGTLVAQADPAGGVQLTMVREPAINDFNGDGISDILWRNDSGTVVDWLGQPNGGFANNAGNTSVTVPNDWRVVGIGDFNGDNRDDILWRHNSGTMTDWLGTANGGFANNHGNSVAEVPTDWQVMGIGDFNGDGRDDIVWRHAGGTVTNWLGTANGGFANNHPVAGAFVPTDWRIVAVGDFNGDGRSDLLWRQQEGVVTDWLGTANGGYANNHTNSAAFMDTTWHVVGSGDFNGDGHSDILWRNDSGMVTNWLGLSNGGFTSNAANASIGAASDWNIIGIGDYNGDGRDDVLWRGPDGTVATWLGQTNGGFTSNPVFGRIGAEWRVQPDKAQASNHTQEVGREIVAQSDMRILDDDSYSGDSISLLEDEVSFGGLLHEWGPTGPAGSPGLYTLTPADFSDLNALHFVETALPPAYQDILFL